MATPVFNGPTMRDETTVKAAQKLGHPVIDGLQVVGHARRQEPGKAAVNWYHFEDGTEVVRDDAGNPAEWE